VLEQLEVLFSLRVWLLAKRTLVIEVLFVVEDFAINVTTV
jgi:hypothetical protein